MSGRVQGVFFRVRCEQMARQRDLTGFVTNLPDGRVEAVFEGADGAVDAAVAWCREGPRGARVEAAEVGDSAILVDMTSFETHFTFAEALAQTGNKKRARFELESALLCPAEPSRLAEAKRRLARR